MLMKMGQADYRQAIENYVAQEAKPQEKFGHQPRLYALSVNIGKDQTYDDDVVYAAAWLHDLGVFEGHRPEDLEELKRWDNTAYAMRESPAILSRLGFPLDKIAAVVEAIRTHQPHLQPTSIEGTVLRDADILEQLGAIGTLRTVCKIGRDTRFPNFTSAVESLEKALAHLPQQLHLPAARELAEARIQILTAFLAAARSEAGASLH